MTYVYNCTEWKVSFLSGFWYEKPSETMEDFKRFYPNLNDHLRWNVCHLSPDENCHVLRFAVSNSLSSTHGFMIDVTKKVIHWEANHPRVYVSVFSRKSLTSIVPIKHLSFPLVSYHFQSNHHGNQRLFAASCIPYNCWILHQLGQLWARHDLSALASLLPCLSPFWIQIVWSRLGYVSFSKSTSMYLLKICGRTP